VAKVYTPNLRSSRLCEIIWLIAERAIVVLAGPSRALRFVGLLDMFLTLQALSDRFCIYSNQTVNVVLSPQAALSCEEWNLGCTLGSLPNFAWSFLQRYGRIRFRNFSKIRNLVYFSL
jgi:hypothetical protein